MYVFCRIVAVINDYFSQRYSSGGEFCVYVCMYVCEVGTESLCTIYINFELKRVTYSISLSLAQMSIFCSTLLDIILKKVNIYGRRHLTRTL
jgi:hypothetical protein